jgi:hypothetical protein
MTNKGWKLDGDEESIRLKKGKLTICFDIKILTPKGVVDAMKLLLQKEFCGVTEISGPKMSYLEAHAKLGHVSTAETKRIGKLLGWVLTGEEERCKACAIGKAQHKGVVKKSTYHPASKIGKRMFLDISSVKNTDFPEIDSIPKPVLAYDC